MSWRIVSNAIGVVAIYHVFAAKGGLQFLFRGNINHFNGIEFFTSKMDGRYLTELLWDYENTNIGREGFMIITFLRLTF